MVLIGRWPGESGRFNCTSHIYSQVLSGSRKMMYTNDVTFYKYKGLLDKVKTAYSHRRLRTCQCTCLFDDLYK